MLSGPKQKQEVTGIQDSKTIRDTAAWPYGKPDFLILRGTGSSRKHCFSVIHDLRRTHGKAAKAAK